MSDTPTTTPSLAKSLFLGEIPTQNLFPYPFMSGEESENIKMLLESIGDFMSGREGDFREYDKHGAQPESYIQSLRELGLFALIVPEQYGGLGISNAGYSRVLQDTSAHDASTSLTIGAHSSIGMKGLLLFGNEEQKARYLPKLASGEMIAGFCLTEPGSGSDAASIKTHAVKQSDGSWILNGDKIWITNGPIGSFFTVFARTEGEKGKMSAFIVERGFDGVSTGPKEDKMGIRASATSTVAFVNVRVPAANLLGEEGQGFKIAMSILNNGRTGLGGGSVGAMKQCIRHALAHATTREQFGKKIIQFPLIREKLSLMAVQCFAAESLVHLVANLIDKGLPDYSVEAAASKIFASEALWFVAHEALQIAGGTGYMREYPFERVVRDSRINLIFEGTNEILRLYVALSGLKDVGDALKEVKKGVSGIFNDPIKGFGVLSKFASRKVGQYAPVGKGMLPELKPELKELGDVFEHFAGRLSRASDALLMKHGKKIIDEQLACRRVADVAIDLLVGLAMISRINEGQKDLEYGSAVAMAQIFTHAAKRRMNANLQRLISNEDAQFDIVTSNLEKHGVQWDIFKS